MVEGVNMRRADRGGASRRRFLAQLATLGVVATALPLTRARAADAPDLTVFTWSDYDNPMFHQSFVDKHGGSPTFAIFAEEEEALQKLRSGYNPDIAHPCTSSIGRWKSAGVLKPIDTGQLTGWGDIFPRIKQIKGTNFDGQQYIMPWDWGNESLLIRTDLAGDYENSYALMLDERYKGKLSMYDSVDSMTAVAAKIAGIEDPFDMTPDQIAETKAVMKKIHANLKFYWSDTTEVQQALASGELVAGWAWNEAVMNLKEQGLAVEYMQPKERMFTWVCGLALITTGEGSQDQAYDFLNAMLDPASGKNLIEEFGYGHSNSKSYADVDPALLDKLGVGDVNKMFDETNFYSQMRPDQREQMIAIFDEIKAGI
jgi:putative spermidine/putrescine transport system substrate-binding protein/spermidine/putrescine transport system substrate-binding protein